jgi:hypothetical protein
MYVHEKSIKHYSIYSLDIAPKIIISYQNKFTIRKKGDLHLNSKL